MACARIPLAMVPDDAPDVPHFLQSNPLYLGLYNEPDLVGGDTPTTPGNTIDSLVKAVVPALGRTKFLAPAFFNNNEAPNNAWWAAFNSTRPDCLAQLPIISMHLFEPDASTALSLITAMHDHFPSHIIWMTELSPKRPNCNLDQDGVINWVKTLIPQIATLRYVEKVFWNSGEFGPTNTCNPSLTNEDGSATAVLEAFGASTLCG